MKTVIAHIDGRAYRAEVIRQDADVIDVRNLGPGWTTSHNLLAGKSGDAEPYYDAETLKDEQPQKPVERDLPRQPIPAKPSEPPKPPDAK